MKTTTIPCRTRFAALITGLLLSITAFAESIIKDISFSALPGDKVELTITADGPINDPLSFTTDNPARIAVDLADTKIQLDSKTKDVGVGLVTSVTAIEAGKRSRVVLNLVDTAPYTLISDGNKLKITVGAGNDSGTATIVSSEPKERAATTSQASIQDIDFTRGSEGEGRVTLKLSKDSVISDLRQEGKNIVLDLKNTTLPDRLAQKLDVTDFATPVEEISLSQKNNTTRVSIAANGHFEHLAYQANNEYTVEFRPLTKEQEERIKKERLTYTGDRLSLNFQDIEIRSVLQLLADFTGLNLVVSDTVSGSITLRLRNVPWDQALDIILKTKGLSQRRTDNVILIAPTEEIAAREKLDLESQQQIAELAPLRSDLIQVNYAKAETLASLLKSEENRLLSERGNVTVDQRTNTLLVQDTALKLEDIRNLIDRLDIPVRQVLVESRIVIANDDFARDIGVKLGFDRANKIGDSQVLVAGGLPGTLSTASLDTGQFMGVNAAIENPAGSGNRSLLVNLPQTLSNSRGGAINVLVGQLGSYLLSLELSALQQEGKGELISSPRVITSDQNKAIIKQGVEIPYQEASSSGATSVAFKEAVLKLEVTPHITPDDRIIMELLVNQDNPDFSNAVLGVPPVDTRSVETTVLVDNGETVVLGGVFERNKTKNVERVPFLGELPYAGVLFRQTQTQNQNSELLIFVTPKILKKALALN